MREVPFPVNPNEIVMKTILETKTVSRYDYRTLGQIRKEFGKIPNIIDVPHLLSIQIESYRDFLQKDISIKKNVVIAIVTIPKVSRNDLGIKVTNLSIFSVLILFD